MRISEDVLSVLSSCSVDGSSLLITATLDRAMYVKVNKVLEASGFKWDKKSKRHVCESDAESRLDQMLVSGEVEVPKDEFNYFPTPKEVVDKILEMADIESHHLVLEPSAGEGSIADEVSKIAEVQCVEMMKKNFETLIKKHPKSLNEDFLKINPTGNFDRVVMNPPFMKQLDIDHVTHAFNFLNGSGKLVAIMSASVLFRDNKKTQAFRSLVEEHNGTIEKLPEGSFKASGTMVNTVIVTMEKKC